MTSQTVKQIKAQWPLLVIVASIFLSGWAVRETLSREIAGQVEAVETRVNERMAVIQQDVREIRNTLLSGIRIVPPSGPSGAP